MNDVKEVADLSGRIIDEVERALVGKRHVLDLVMAGILSGGHILFEDFPGLGKTLMAKSLAAVLGLAFKRIQFTPDLLPGDITGGYVYSREKESFVLRKGPVFTGVLLGDEINRASPKTQSALLEAMQEYQVTIEGETMPLERPFVVLATQNPIEFEGTFPLPEAQLDRFMMRLSLGYPDSEAEKEILRRRRERKHDEVDMRGVADAASLTAMQEIVEEVFVDDDVESYIVDIIQKTREEQRISVGSSPRGALAFLKLARARAALKGRAYVIPDDVKDFAMPVLGHRIILEPSLWMQKGAIDQVVDGIMRSVPVPVIKGVPGS